MFGTTGGARRRARASWPTTRYIRESILTPQTKLVAGYQPLMPTFQGLVNEEGVMSLIEYIKSLPPRPAAARRHAGDAAPGTPSETVGTHDDHSTSAP